MPSLASIIGFGLLALAMVLTPGPNMIYLISRSVCQGRKAGFVSLAGVATGFLFYMAAASIGLTGLLLAVPYAYDALRFAGAAYLLYLAWYALRPGGKNLFQLRPVENESHARLFAIGLTTNLLNPKIAVLYLSVLPQFIDPTRGHVFAQFATLGLAQILVSISVNCIIVAAAGSISELLKRRPTWATIQRWCMGAVLGAMAIRLATDAGR